MPDCGKVVSPDTSLPCSTSCNGLRASILGRCAKANRVRGKGQSTCYPVLLRNKLVVTAVRGLFEQRLPPSAIALLQTTAPICLRFGRSYRVSEVAVDQYIGGSSSSDGTHQKCQALPLLGPHNALFL